MNILFLSTKAPLPTNDGHSLRTYNIIKGIAKENNVFLCSFVKYDEEYSYKQELEKICKKVVYMDLLDNKSKVVMGVNIIFNLFESKPYVARKYDSNNMRSIIKNLLFEHDIDVVHLDLLPLGCYLDLFKNMNVVLNEHNIESSLLLRRVSHEKSVFKRYYFNIQYNRLKLFEANILKRMNHVIVCSEQDKEIALTLSPNMNISVIPNGVDVEYFSPMDKTSGKNNIIIFVGGMNWFPNRDALEWFDQEIFPKILFKKPDVFLHVIGRAEESFKWKNPKNVKVLGYVDDIRPHLEEATAFIAPLRIGGGTRLKILDAMSMGKAVISTNIGAEGIRITNNKNIIIADVGDNFAKSVILVLENICYRDNIGVEARKFVEEEYQWCIFVNDLLKIYESIKEC